MCRSKQLHFCHDATFNGGDFLIRTYLNRQIEFIKKSINLLLKMAHDSKRQAYSKYVLTVKIYTYFQFSAATFITDHEASI